MSPSPPRIVDRWNINGSLQPFCADEARMYSFVFFVKREPIEELCQRYLNGPSHGAVDYRPPGDLIDLPAVVILTFVRIGRLRSQSGPFAHVGWASETEATLWVFTPAFVGPVPVRPAWFVPYIFVDLPLAISQGREIYGFPKEFGWFHVDTDAWNPEPGDGPHADAFGLDVFGVERFDGSPFGQKPLLRVRRQEPYARGTIATRWADYGAALGEIVGKSWGKLDLVTRLFPRAVEELWPPTVDSVLLKQFFGAGESGQACYQSVVEVGASVAAFRGGGWLSGIYELDLHDLASHPIAADLGLEQGAEARGYWFDFDFRMGPGRTVWQAP
jgi:hypothetical protein